MKSKNMTFRVLAIAMMAVVVGFGACKKKSSECEILEFKVNGVVYTKNQAGTEFTYHYTKTLVGGVGTWAGFWTGQTVAPTIQISPKASINPPASNPQDFLDKWVEYTVTAEDGTVKKYKVRATRDQYVQ